MCPNLIPFGPLQFTHVPPQCTFVPLQCTCVPLQCTCVPLPGTYAPCQCTCVPLHAPVSLSTAHVSHGGRAGAGEPEVGAADGAAVQLGAGQPHHVPHPDRPVHGARLALPLRLPSPGQHCQCHQGRAPGEFKLPVLCMLCALCMRRMLCVVCMRCIVCLLPVHVLHAHHE